MQGVDARIFADLHDPADPAVAADGSGLVLAARQTVADDELDIAVVRTHRRRTVRLRPSTRRRATVRPVRVGGRVRRTRIADAAGHRRAIRVRSLSA